MFRINCRFSEEVLIPAEGVREKECVTLDGVSAVVSYLGAWDNKDGYYEEELDGLCEEKWKMPFKSLRSVWIARLGRVSELWYLIGLKKV